MTRHEADGERAKRIEHHMRTSETIRTAVARAASFSETEISVALDAMAAKTAEGELASWAQAYLAATLFAYSARLRDLSAARMGDLDAAEGEGRR